MKYFEKNAVSIEHVKSRINKIQGLKNTFLEAGRKSGANLDFLKAKQSQAHKLIMTSNQRLNKLLIKNPSV